MRFPCNGQNHFSFVKGAKWTEEEVGTNAIGTGLLLKKPIQTSGAEHYCLKHHNWTCSATPVFDKNGQIAGMLDMSGPLSGTHLHTLGMVVAAAEAIMDQMRILEKNRQLAISSTRLAKIFQNMSDGVLVINNQGVIMDINPVAKQIIGKSDRDLVGHSIQELLGKRVPAIEKTLMRKESYNDEEVIVDTVNGRVHCLSSGICIMDEESSVTDIVILVRPIEKVQKFVNSYTGAQANFHFKDIIGNSPPMVQTIRMAARAAGGNSNVLLEGESGTGKEMFAQAIHNSSSRGEGPFVALNCGAIPRELIASELFGYVEGAFTGAKRGGRPGKLELAAGGTLFLDEIGDMPLEQQVSLLRVLQERKITRIGDDKIIPVDFRVISATNKNLQHEVVQGNFRQDLYYRLDVVTINIPPLRDRCEDIPLLLSHFIEIIGQQWENMNIKVDSEVIKYLKQCPWPGNVRELQNVVERLINISEDGCIHLHHLLSSLNYSRDELPAAPSLIAEPVRVHSVRDNWKRFLEEKESQEITRLLVKHGGNISKVAKEMNVSRNTVYRKMRLYGINY